KEPIVAASSGNPKRDDVTTIPTKDPGVDTLKPATADNKQPNPSGGQAEEPEKPSPVPAAPVKPPESARAAPRARQQKSPDAGRGDVVTKKKKDEAPSSAAEAEATRLLGHAEQLAKDAHNARLTAILNKGQGRSSDPSKAESLEN